jgi:hypothetical protein
MKQFGSYNLQASHQSPFTFCWSAPIRSDMAHLYLISFSCLVEIVEFWQVSLCSLPW